MAQRLKYRGGAVTAVLAAARRAAGLEDEEVITPPPTAYAGPAGTADDIAALAAMSRNDAGFPGIGYSGG